VDSAEEGATETDGAADRVAEAGSGGNGGTSCEFCPSFVVAAAAPDDDDAAAIALAASAGSTKVTGVCLRVGVDSSSLPRRAAPRLEAFDGEEEEDDPILLIGEGATTVSSSSYTSTTTGVSELSCPPARSECAPESARR